MDNLCLYVEESLNWVEGKSFVLKLFTCRKYRFRKFVSMPLLLSFATVHREVYMKSSSVLTCASLTELCLTYKALCHFVEGKYQLRSRASI